MSDAALATVQETIRIQPFGATAMTLHRRLEVAFDTHIILNRGRMHPDC